MGYYEIEVNDNDCVRIDIEDEFIEDMKDLFIDEKDKETGHYIRRERYAGACERSFYVGSEVKQEDIKGEFKHGILKLFVPKKEAKEVEENKYIAIEG